MKAVQLYLIAGLVASSMLVSCVPKTQEVATGGKATTGYQDIRGTRTEDMASTKPPDIQGYELYQSGHKEFIISIPKGWEKSEKGHPYGDLTKISGVRLNGPKNKDGVPVTISSLHYSGDHFFKTPDEFISNKLNSIVRIDYDRKAIVSDIQIAGRPGKKFYTKTFELVYLPRKEVPPMEGGRVYEIAPPSKRVIMIQQFIVVPAKQGFYALNYAAPEELCEEYQGIFEKVIVSFQPSLQ